MKKAENKLVKRYGQEMKIIELQNRIVMIRLRMGRLMKDLANPYKEELTKLYEAKIVRIKEEILETNQEIGREENVDIN